MRSLLFASVLVLRLSGSRGLPGESLNDPRSSRVRPVDQFCEQVIADGRRRSPTFAGLVGGLERHDVIVYISVDPNLSLRGSLTFIVHTGSWTYLRVRVHPTLGPDDAIAALAHELRHATEVASASRPVTNERELEELYRGIGFDSGPARFESNAARVTEVQVRRELRSKPEPDGASSVPSVFRKSLRTP
jgi:hypothetical protein